MMKGQIEEGQGNLEGAREAYKTGVTALDKYYLRCNLGVVFKTGQHLFHGITAEKLIEGS